MIKKILPIALAVVFSIIIFIAGAYTGIYGFASIKTTSMLQDIFIASADVNLALDYLDHGEAEKARQFLLLKQDGVILSINSLSEYTDKASYKTACHILKRINQNRKADPGHYSMYTYGNDIPKSDVIKKEVSLILEKWSAASCEKN